MKGLFKRLLNVKGMIVEDVPVDNSPLRPAPVLVVRVRRRKGALRCSRCGRKCPKYDDGGGERRWRHQDFGRYGVEPMGLAPRVACAEHGVAVAQVPWAEPGSRFTRDFEMERAWLTAVASRKTVGGFLRIAWRTAGDIARRVAARLGSSTPCMFDGLTAIGVDETSYRKGRTYITVVVDHKRKRVVRAHDGYGKEVLDPFFRQLTDEQRASITAVTGDDAKWIDASVKEHLPNAERVLDSFHIVSWMTDTLDQVRKRLWNQARRGNDKTATETMKGLKYAVPQEPRRPDRTAIRSVRDARGHGSQGPALPVMAVEGTPQDAPAPTRRTSRSRIETMDLPGFPQPHPRGRGTVQEDPQTQGRHPRNHRTRLLQRASGSVQQQDQGHHPHGLRLPTRRQPHRHDQTPMQRPTHPPTNTHPLTHENNRRLK